jgi:hypothetical protein
MATTTAKASCRVIAYTLGLEDAKPSVRHAMLMKEDLRVSMATTTTKASHSVTADPPGLKDVSWDG